MIKSLYLGLVIPKLEYASLVWSPTYLNQMNRVEQIQKNFLKFLSWKVDGVPIKGVYDVYDLCERFDMLSLSKRRTVCSAIMFVFKVLRGNVDCPQFLQLPIRILALNSRYQVPFYLPMASSRLTLSSPIYRACTAVYLLVDYCEGAIDIMTSPLPEVARFANKYIVSQRP